FQQQATVADADRNALFGVIDVGEKPRVGSDSHDCRVDFEENETLIASPVHQSRSGAKSDDRDVSLVGGRSVPGEGFADCGFRMVITERFSGSSFVEALPAVHDSAVTECMKGAFKLVVVDLDDPMD